VSRKGALFTLPPKEVFCRGIRYSSLIDLKKSKVYHLNESASEILNLLEGGRGVREIAKEMEMDLTEEEIREFLDGMVKRKLLKTSTRTMRRRSPPPMPPKLDFIWCEVTARCNLKCIHCYASVNNPETKHEDPSTRFLKRVMEEAAQEGCRQIQLTGGEPLLRKDIGELVDHARALNFDDIEIFTNGTLLREPLVRFLSERSIGVALSLYSYREETHDYITGVPGSHSKTLKGLKMLLDYGVKTRCSLVAMKQNEEEIEKTANILSMMGLCGRAPDHVRPVGGGKGRGCWPKKYSRTLLIEEPPCEFDEEMYRRNETWNDCWFGKAAVTSSGDVIPCVFAREQVAGSLIKEPLKAILHGKMLEYWGLNADKIEVCNGCEFRYICNDCRPWSYGLTGSLLAKNPGCTYDPSTGKWGGNCKLLQYVC
jgi:radical SAM protein with 4Fe4S-binding SPASM domain